MVLSQFSLLGASKLCFFGSLLHFKVLQNLIIIDMLIVLTAHA